MSDEVGLCKDCVFSRVIESAKGSLFYLCRLSETDSRFTKYPPLPVLSCTGYRKSPNKEPRNAER